MFDASGTPAVQDEERIALNKHWPSSDPVYRLNVVTTLSVVFIVLLTIFWLAHPHQRRLVYIPLGTKVITAYHAVTAECDSTPDIGAGGRVAINGVPTGKWAACNFLPFGTKLVIPAVSGNTVWTVRDRMNSRFPHRVDLLIRPGAAFVQMRKTPVFIVAEVK